MTKSIFNKDIKLLRKNQFLFGFEVECIFISKKITKTVLAQKLKAIHNKIILADDGSITFREDGEFSAEIKTPPLKAYESFRVLKQVLSLVEQYGRTNRSCGFHVNFSPISDKLYYSINPFALTQDRLWNQIKKTFNRESNSYCSAVNLPKSFKKPITIFDIWQASQRYVDAYDTSRIEVQHYHVCNMSNYHKQKHKSSRIEIRAFGGSGYHKKFSEITFYCEKIIKTFFKHCAKDKVKLM